MRADRLYAALLYLLCAVLLALAPRVLAVPPSAPTVLAPANGASVQIPFTAQWSAVSEPGVIAYNWQVSTSSTFSPVQKIGSTSTATQAAVSGLANGTYFFRVQAVNSGFEQGAWSAARSFTVSGASAQAPGKAVLDPPVGYATFHPWESMRFTWSAVPGAASYIYEASTDARFPITNTIRFDNIPQPQYGFAIANPEGSYTARVYAVNADGTVGQPSNTITFSVFYANPVPPAPQPTAPAAGATLTLPITFGWTHTLNPQDSGYELQISPFSDFRTNEVPTAVQITPNSYVIRSLTAGTKFWRVRSHQGMASPTTTAVTAWSPVRSFTVSSAPPVPVSVTPLRIPLFSGDDTWVELQLSGPVPSAGGNVALSSSHPAIVPVPATVAVQGSQAWTQFRVVAGQVTAPTPITLTATYNGVSASSQFTLNPPALQSITFSGAKVSAGVPLSGVLMLAGQAPAGGAVVSLASNTPAVQPPASVTVPAGSYSAPLSLPTSDVSTQTTATITASWNGVSTTSTVTLMPAPHPLSLTLFPATINAGQVSDGLVTVDATATFDQYLRVSSNNPDLLPFLSTLVVIPAGDNRGAISLIPKNVVAQTTVARISVTGSGVTRFADLTVNPSGTPAPAATLSSFTVTPASVTGGQSATGRVTLAQAAPAGGTSVALGSNLPGSASVPASVLVPQGATSADFTIATFPSAGTTVQLSARLGDTILFASLAVTAAPSGPTLSSLALSPTTVTGGASVTGTVTLTGAAPAGGASVVLSDNASAIVTPASVTVPAGATSANFTVTTAGVSAATTGAVTASFGGVSKSASLTVNPPATGTATLTVSASGRGGERITSTPAGISVAVGSTGSAAFAAGASVTLAVTNGRDAIWSGACSSNGNKARTCTLTLNANGSVAANVQ
ncbi:MAG TPA: hypothetical protein VF522_12010 [Ramlibacter sp.]|uniref:hypothetical protein n=1 Tax=Ramlibacter sp. TaxID=1917967 RepID=UPI002ED171C9